jgi:DNA (cytosine-5)-methyltransferase 1
MANHPNRGRASGPSSNPAPAAIKALRESIMVPGHDGELRPLTQTQAAQLVHGTLRAWQQWEAGDRRMHPGLWELFQLKTAAIWHPEDR